MSRRARKSCPRCRQLEKQLEELRGTVLQIKEMLRGAHKSSPHSSKPPASDIAKPPPPMATGSPRSIGGQPGHPKHEREPFRAEQVTSFAEHALDACPCCGGELRLSGALPRVGQQGELLPARRTTGRTPC